ncbi:hypothetical protein K488DRAFT_74910 [Vararia minispora EC-137]|uniref:Uncharacterized protein n=1 Tax=Vararia minispora EC-137 TaxID=1314806 RepID=A0ACB8Q5E1_9AGAM|nr:hypothetical protein K488DRAFT_74910 [Vararia minispora EC-137]
MCRAGGQAACACATNCQCQGDIWGHGRGTSCLCGVFQPLCARGGKKREDQGMGECGNPASGSMCPAVDKRVRATMASARTLAGRLCSAASGPKRAAETVLVQGIRSGQQASAVPGADGKPGEGKDGKRGMSRRSTRVGDRRVQVWFRLGGPASQAARAHQLTAGWKDTKWRQIRSTRVDDAVICLSRPPVLPTSL